MLKSDVILLFYYTKSNRYSVNAITGAIESNPDLCRLKLDFSCSYEELLLKLKSYIDEFRLIILALSFFTTQIWEMYKLIREIRNRYANRVLIICGGAHSTGMPEDVLKTGADIVVLGEAEETFSLLLKKILKQDDYKDLKCIAYIRDGNIRYSIMQEYIVLDKYQPFGIKHNKFGPIEITRGCPYVCFYCQTPRIFGTKIRHRSIDIICKYIEIMKRYKMTDIRFISPNAFSYGSKDGKSINYELIESLLKNIRKVLKDDGRIFFGTFPSEVRPESVNYETIKLILKYADNDNITIGAQTGSDRLLKLICRSHTVKDVFNAVKVAIKYNIKPNVDFIFGLPGENDEDINETIRVIEDLANMGARIHCHTFIPLPQTPFAKSEVKPINRKYIKAINMLIHKGVVFGEWKKQEEIAFRLYKYFCNKTIEE